MAAGGLDNSVRTPFTIKAHNKAGWGPAVTVEGQSAGNPDAPDAPRLETTEVGGGASQAVVVTWSAVPPNGPGDTRYTVTRTGPGGSTDVCTATTATRCDTPSVANDGSTYEYRVVASNDHFSSPASAATSLQAVGTPGDFSGVSATATGDDRSVRLRFTSPPAHDESETITCRVGGTSCGTWSAPADPRSYDQVVTVPGNGSAYTLTLTATNTGGLSSSTQVSTDVVYGPLGAASVTVDATVGPYVTFTVRVDPNGRPADVAVEVTGGVGGTVDRSDTTGGDPWSKQYTVKVGYSVTPDLSATVTRGSESATASSTSATNGYRITAAGQELSGGGARSPSVGRTSRRAPP